MCNAAVQHTGRQLHGYRNWEVYCDFALPQHCLVDYCTVGTDWDGWKQVAALLQSSPKPQKFKFQKIDIPWNFHNHLDHQYCEFAMPSTFFLFFYYLHSVLYQHKTVFSEFWLATYLTITNSSTPPNYLGLQQYTKIFPNKPKFRVSLLHRLKKGIIDSD